MAHTIAIAAETAAETAQQVNDHDNDEYHSKRHGTRPNGRPVAGNPLPPRLKRKAYPGLWFQRGNPERLFRLWFQRGLIDAVAQSGRAGAVLENMAEMAVAL